MWVDIALRNHETLATSQPLISTLRMIMIMIMSKLGEYLWNLSDKDPRNPCNPCNLVTLEGVDDIALRTPQPPQPCNL